jgi:hypothetical protein
MNKAEYRVLFERGRALAADLESDNPEVRKATIAKLAHGSGFLLASTIRHVQITHGRKANDAVRRLCDAIGNA